MIEIASSCSSMWKIERNVEDDANRTSALHALIGKDAAGQSLHSDLRRADG